jgi:hypothetical protein
MIFLASVFFSKKERGSSPNTNREAVSNRMFKLAEIFDMTGGGGGGVLIKRMAGLSTWDSKSISIAQCEIKGEGREPNKVVNVSQVD